MKALIVLAFLVQSLIQYPQRVGNELDEATHLCMELRTKYLNQEMTRLQQELEQSSLERTLHAWGALLWAALHKGHFWALAGVLGFLLAQWFRLRRRSREPHSSGPQENASKNLEVEENEEKDDVVAKKEGKTDDTNVEGDSKDGNAEDGGHFNTNKEDNFGNEGKDENEDETGEEVNNDVNVEEVNKDGNSEDGGHFNTNKEDDFGNEGKDENEDETGEEVNNDVNVEEVNKDGNSEDGSRVYTNEEEDFENEENNESEDENKDQVIGSVNEEEDNAAGREERKYGENGDKEQDVESKLARFIEERMRWPVLDRGGLIIDLIDDLTRTVGQDLSNHFYPMLQRSIGLDSAFEGWSPCKEAVVYRVLVPLTPPLGHAFHLELDIAGKVPGKNFYIRVEQVCTCTREQQGKKVLCFLHDPGQELRRNEELSLLHSLCTGSYLDVEKTTQWFCLLVRANWLLLPQSCHWHLRLLHSFRSCKFRLSKGRESLWVEVLFGVQQGDSDIYVSSQPAEALFTPSTVWPETYAVAEMKFFSHIARQAPRDSCHLKCLQLLTRAVVGRHFSTYILKTIMMHLLNTIPMSQWGRRDFLERLSDSLDYLLCCLKKKQLDCFVVGNQSIPVGINLPPHFRTVEPPNLFRHLAQNPQAYTKAVQDYLCLRGGLKQFLLTAAHK